MDDLKDELMDARLRIGRLEGQVDDLRHWIGTLVVRLDALENEQRAAQVQRQEQSKP